MSDLNRKSPQSETILGGSPTWPLKVDYHPFYDGFLYERRTVGSTFAVKSEAVADWPNIASSQSAAW